MKWDTKYMNGAVLILLALTDTLYICTFVDSLAYQ